MDDIAGDDDEDIFRMFLHVHVHVLVLLYSACTVCTVVATLCNLFTNILFTFIQLLITC